MASPGAHITATGDFNLQTDEGARRFQSLTEALRRLTASTTPKIVPARTLSNSPPFATEGDRAWPVHNQLSSASPPFIPAAQQAAMAAAQPPMVPVLAPYAAPSAPEGDWGASAFLQPHHQHMVVTSAYHPHQAPYQPGPAGHPDPISPVSLVNASGNKPPVPLHPLQPVAVTNDSMTAGDSPTSQRIILVDDRLTDVWQSVVNPADPAKAASNLTRLLPAPNAYEVAAEFLTRPSHTAVIERIPDAGQRLKLAHQVLLALVRRGSTDFAAQWPSTVRLATKSEASAAADVQNAAEALGELLRKDLAPRAVAVTAMTFLLGHPRTVDFALRVLWHCAVASDREHGSPSESSSTAEGAVTQFPELREAVQNALAQTSYVAHRLATAFGWRAPSTTNLTYTAALRALPSDRVAFSPSADTLVTSSYQHGINLWDTAAIAAGEPKVLLADRRIIAVDVIAKKDSVVAVAGPPDVPTLFNVDLKPKGGGAARITASVLMDVDSVTALKTISHRSAAVCLGVVAGKDYELRLYSATGSADRSIAKAHDDFITCIATSSDSDSTIFSGARDGVVRVWDLRSTQRSASSLHPHKAAVSGISASRDVLLTGGLDGTLRLWDVRKLVDPIDTATFDAPVLSLTCTSKGVAFVSTARQLSVMTLHPLALEDTLPGSYHALAATPSGEGLFAVGSGQQGVHVFTLKTA